MEIVETTVFARQIDRLLSSEEYRDLQLSLIETPTAGALIPGSGGLRKIRFGKDGRGKRGGIRVIYYLTTADQQIFMLVAYSKSERSDLGRDEIKALKKLVEDLK